MFSYSHTSFPDITWELGGFYHFSTDSGTFTQIHTVSITFNFRSGYETMQMSVEVGESDRICANPAILLGFASGLQPSPGWKKRKIRKRRRQRDPGRSFKMPWI